MLTETILHITSSIYKHFGLLILLLAISSCQKENCEEGNLIKNASFENLNAQDFPSDWEYSLFQMQDPIIVDPVYTNSKFTNDPNAIDGDNYIILKVTDNETLELITQELDENFEEMVSYKLKVSYAQNPNVFGPSASSQMNVPYLLPAVLRIWAGYKDSIYKFLIHETNGIEDSNWITEEIEYSPDENYTHLSFEAFYKTPLIITYNGNVMIDDIELQKVCP